MDVMLRVLQENPIASFDTDTIIKSTVLNLLAGSDSIMVAITWILSLMLNNPQVLKKAQDELDNKIGRNRQVEESDIKDLVYLQAIVKESLRLSSPSAVIFPRAAMKDCTLSTGYHIPAGTKLMINIWKIMHDENLWPDPYSFQPERFLCSSHKDIDVRGQHYELLPFGSGRRSCPGISLSLNVMHLILAALLHSFEITTPSNEPVDMTKSIGLTNVKATPLEVLLIPRLNCVL
ncbi:Cytochrome P450 [Arachis hypogaea]|nr:Cytochrome P450 [Arachis hypogaea]